MGVMQLGDLRWRVDPSSVDWSFQLDTAVINTIGGQVVQILGATLSDLVVQGEFGQDHKSNTVSWKLAAAFHTKIKSFMDRQTLPAKTVHSGGSRRSGILSDAGVIHDPLPFTYHDGLHNWTFKVLVKALDDGDGSGSLNITNGKFAYKYKLTLFIVESESTLIRKVASDYFMSRISDGLGWKQTSFNGPPSAQDAQDFITVNGGTVSAFLDKVLTGEKLNEPSPTTTPSKSRGHVSGQVPIGRRPGHGIGAI
jgi:hypothetical protein